MTFHYGCHGSNAFTVSCLAIELSLGCYDQICCTYSFFESHCLQYDLRARPQCCAKESDQPCTQAASGTRSWDITHGSPKVTFDDLRIMSERLVQLYNHLGGCTFLRAVDR